MNRMMIHTVAVRGNRLECGYCVTGDWKTYFRPEEPFFAEYSKSMEGVPGSVAVIPFLCSVLPIAWVCGAELVLEELDRDFYESMDAIRNGYAKMYQKLKLGGRVTVKNLVSNHHDPQKTAMLFSGGVDATHTLISHMAEKPVLVTLWGSDIGLEDEPGWKRVEDHTVRTAAEYGLDYLIVKSSFRRFLRESTLTEAVYASAGDNWWHGFQHGIGLLGHLAPFACLYHVKTAYIASSYTASDKKVTCASDPSIDNYVRFCGCRAVHDGYEYNRQEKIRRICSYAGQTGTPIRIRVCWESRGGSNCCRCEKCYRTILGFLAEGERPQKYGFDYTDDAFTGMMLDLKKRIHLEKTRYLPVQKALRENYAIAQVDRRLRWFYRRNIGFEEARFRTYRKVRGFLGGIKRSLFRA